MATKNSSDHSILYYVMKDISPISKFLCQLFVEFKQNGIRYAILRNYESLPFSTGGSDIDMWIHSFDVSHCLHILRNVSWNHRLNLVSYYGDSTTVKICLQNDNGGVQFDLFLGDIYYKEKILLPSDSIVANTISYNDISVLTDLLSNLLAYMKELINNMRVKQKYIEPILSNRVFYTQDYLVQNLKNYSSEFIQKLYYSISSSSIDRDSSNLAKLCRTSLSKKGQANKGSIIISKIGRLFRKKPGYVLAVEGTDGSGKSFIINSITPILNGAFHNGIIYNHLRPHCIPDIAELFGKREKRKDATMVVVSDPHAQKQSGVLGSLVRWSYYMIDYTWGYMRKVWLPIHSKSKVFIFDRYYYEYYLDQKRSHVNLPMWIIHFGEFFIPKPDLILCLGGDPEKIYARKPETSLEEVTRQTKVLKEFCAKRKNAVWIDTTIAPEESINAAMKAINDMMSKRFDINDLK